MKTEIELWGEYQKAQCQFNRVTDNLVIQGIRGRMLVDHPLVVKAAEDQRVAFLAWDKMWKRTRSS